MINKLKVLIAEDTRMARELLINDLNEFARVTLNAVEYFDIEEAETFEKAHQKIVESGNTQNYYDIIFADIDFTEDNKGGKSDSGYKLIEKAFEVCPITKIATYSGQFRAAELWPKYEELKNRGLIVKTFDKSHSEAGNPNWLKKGVNEIVEEINANSYIRDIWDNHQLVKENMRIKKYGKDPFIDVLIKNTIHLNIDSALMLLMNIDKFDAKEIIYRLIIYLYHNSLEIYCRADKTDEQIIEESDKNKINAEEFIGLLKINKNLKFPLESVNSQRIFVASISDYRIKFADKLNFYRNLSIHQDPNKKRFIPDLAHVLYSSLAFSLIVTTTKEKIKTSHIKSYSSKLENVFGALDLLKEIISKIIEKN